MEQEAGHGEDFGGRIGCSWRETDPESANRETLIRDLADGQYSHPLRIAAFNTAEGWSRDVTKDIADELRRLASMKSRAQGTNDLNCRFPALMGPRTGLQGLLQSSNLRRKDWIV